MSSFRYVEVVVTGAGADASEDWDLLGPVWSAAASVTAGSEELASLLRAAGAAPVEVCDPFEGAGLHRSSLLAGTVHPLEHGELMARVRARRLLGTLARKLLGRRAPAVRAHLWRLASFGRTERGSRKADREA
jgi:hypothetical protein